MSPVAQEQITILEHLSSPSVFDGVIILVFCIFVLCLVYQMLPDSLDCHTHTVVYKFNEYALFVVREAKMDHRNNEN